MTDSNKFNLFGIVFYFFILLIFLSDDKKIVLLINYPVMLLTNTMPGQRSGFPVSFIIAAVIYNLLIGYILGRVFFWINTGIKNKKR